MRNSRSLCVCSTRDCRCARIYSWYLAGNTSPPLKPDISCSVYIRDWTIRFANSEVWEYGRRGCYSINSIANRQDAGWANVNFDKILAGKTFRVLCSLIIYSSTQTRNYRLPMSKLRQLYDTLCMSGILKVIQRSSSLESIVNKVKYID